MIFEIFKAASARRSLLGRGFVVVVVVVLLPLIYSKSCLPIPQKLTENHMQLNITCSMSSLMVINNNISNHLCNHTSNCISNCISNSDSSQNDAAFKD